VDAVKIHSIRTVNQFQIGGRKISPFALCTCTRKGFRCVVQNLKTFLAAGEEITFSPLTTATMTGNTLGLLGLGHIPESTAARSRRTVPGFPHANPS